MWSDVVCPWCYIGKRRFERALARFPHRDQVQIRWRAFELDPTAPAVREGDPARRLAARYGMSPDQARAAQARITAAAAEEGLEYRLGGARSGNTFDAHRVIRLAADRGVQDRVAEALMAAYLCEEMAIGDRGVLVEVAGRAGLDPAEVRTALEEGSYAGDVREDQAEAAARGITGVPFFLLGGRFGIPGAQDPDTILVMLGRAWERRDPTPDGPAGGPAQRASGPGPAPAR